MKNRTIVRVVIGGLVGIAIAAGFFLFPLRDWMTWLLIWVRGFGAAGAVIYAVLYALAVLFLPGLLLTAGAGLVYGPVVGTLIVSPASVAGATLAFLLARYFSAGWAEKKIAANPKFAAISGAAEKNGFRLTLLLRLQPVLPFILLNYALGLTRVRLRDYVIASWLGMLPATILYVYAGSALRNIGDLFRPGALTASGGSRLLFWGGLAVSVLLAVFAGRLARRALRTELDPSAEARSVA